MPTLEIWQAILIALSPLVALTIVYWMDYRRVDLHWSIAIAMIVCFVFAVVGI